LNSSQAEADALEKKLNDNAKNRKDRETKVVALKSTPSGYIIKDGLQCKFNTNSYKLVFVVNSENFFYLKGALKRAKEVSQWQ
jgi:hypothetical protein